LVGWFVGWFSQPTNQPTNLNQLSNQNHVAFKTQPAEIKFPTFGKPSKPGYHLLSDPQISQISQIVA
jgi:hypothetical protein